MGKSLMGANSYLQIDQAMSKAVMQGVFPGGVLLWGTRDQIVFHRSFGNMDLDGGEPMEANAIFDLASLTKPLATALAAAQLIGENQFDLHTPLAEVLPEVRGGDKASITIDMLMRHTSGLPAHREYFKKLPPKRSRARNALRQCILAEPLESAPGQKELYSDLGYMLLAWVVEKCSGRQLDQFVYDHIYSPLGIEDLFFIPLESSQNCPGGKGNAHKSLSMMPTSHCPWRGKLVKGEVEDENAWAAGGIEGHAGLFGDALSVYRLCCEIMAALCGKGAKVLDPGIIRSFVRKEPGRVKVAGFDTPSCENSSSGQYFSKEAIGHLGFTGTSFWMDPVNGLIAVLLTNRVHPSRDNWKIKTFRPLIHDLVSLNYNRNIRV